MAKKYDDNLNDIMDIVNKYVEVVKKNYKVETIILFGSYAKGTNDEESDIDIAVVTDDFDGDEFDAQAALSLLRKGIDYRIEVHLVTVADYKAISYPLVWEIVNTGINTFINFLVNLTPLWSLSSEQAAYPSIIIPRIIVLTIRNTNAVLPIGSHLVIQYNSFISLNLFNYLI